MLSKGYGFVEFESVETATSACRDVQGIVLDGHTLALRLCEAKSVSDMDSKPCTILVVKNLPFDGVDVKDVIQLFSPFGQIKSVRFPSLNTGDKTGFGIVEFVTKQEASNAIRALSSTRLYGRRLMVEWAVDDYSTKVLQDRENDTRPKKRQMLRRCSSSLRD